MDDTSWRDGGVVAAWRRRDAHHGRRIMAAKPWKRRLERARIIDQDARGVVTPRPGVGIVVRYREVMGGNPPRDWIPEPAQVWAMEEALETGRAPYADFGVWRPAVREVAESWDTIGPGELQRARRPLPTSFQAWKASWKVLRTVRICIGCVTVTALDGYEAHIESLTGMYPESWETIVSADDHARRYEVDRIVCESREGEARGKPEYAGYKESGRWDFAYRELVGSGASEFWDRNVHRPLSLGLARAGRGEGARREAKGSGGEPAR